MLNTKLILNYSGKSTKYEYNPEKQKYDLVITGTIDYAKSEITQSCYNLPKFINSVNLYGCGNIPPNNNIYSSPKNEVYAVVNTVIFPKDQENQYREFYRKIGFELDDKPTGVTWQVEYYRFAGKNDNLGDWLFYTGNGKFENWQNTKWMKYQWLFSGFKGWFKA